MLLCRSRKNLQNIRDLNFVLMSYVLLVDVHPKKKRGPTRMLDVWEIDTESCIIVNLDKYGRPIGPEGTTLTRFIGSLVQRKQYASIKYKSWKDMPNEEKDAMLAQIEGL